MDTNWTRLGGQRTVFRYQTMLSETPLLTSNIMTIAGKMGDGQTVLDVVLN